MKEYVDMMLRIRVYENDDIIMASVETPWEDDNVDEGGWV
jgi:hypothetical protein